MEEFECLPIGIDLGTTFSCIGVYRNAAVEIIPNEKNDRTTPSIVSFLDNEIYVGEQTEYKRLKDPKNKIFAVKRIIGRNFKDNEVQEDIKNLFTYKVIEDEKGRPKIEVDSNGVKRYSPEEISAKILSKLKQSAESFLQKKIKKVVITVPAYFTERQKQATENAGKIAGLHVIKIINEPTAASLAYGFGKHQNNKTNDLLGKSFFFCDGSNTKELFTYRSNTNFSENSQNFEKETKKIIVFDLGGGTLDVSLLELEEGDISVKAHSGIMHLGGEDFDNILVKYCVSQFYKKTRIDLNKKEYIKQILRLKEHCEKAKRVLSYETEAVIEAESIANGKDLLLKISRAKFEELCKDLFIRIKEPLNKVFAISKEKKENIDEIILVGGSTRIPKIQSILKEYFNKNELNNKLNPDEAVAYGATIEAAMEMGKFAEDVTLLDVCPFSLGVATREEKYYKENGLTMTKIIEKGTKLPIKKTKKFMPAFDFSNSLLIEIFEGENKFANDNYPLGKFKLMDIPYKKKEEVNIDITFELDENSILTVTGIIKENNCSNSIVIKNDKGGLSKNEIEEAKIKNYNETKGDDLEPAMIIERNYKKEISYLMDKINSEIDLKELYGHLINLKSTIENFINSFNNDLLDNHAYKEKMHFYLIYLFNAYSYLLNLNELLPTEEKENIIRKTKKYLEIFEKSGTNFCRSLVYIFIKNEDDIFGELCIQILGYYSQRGTELYSNNEKKYAKHYIEEALLINENFSVEKRIEKNSELQYKHESILDNCIELINILKAESLEKYCKSFSQNNLISENEYTNEEQKLDILDRFKEALRYLKEPKKRADKLLKAIYIANIIKIEYKMFNSNNYDTLLKMIEKCVNLKLEVPEGCEANDLDWFDEICKYKVEIEKKQQKLSENPKEEDNKIKENLKEIINNINKKFNEGKINFFYYILTEHEPNGLDSSLIFKNINEFKEYYNNCDKNKFIKKLNRLYNPQRYKGDKIEERKIHLIMQEISMKINNLD